MSETLKPLSAEERQLLHDEATKLRDFWENGSDEDLCDALNDFQEHSPTDLLRALADLAAAEKRIETFIEYLEFINKANESAITIAWVHGWRCPEADMQKEQEFRERLGLKQ